MASHSVTGTYVPVGLNHGNQFFIDAVTTEALAAAQTLSVTVAADFVALPLSLVAYSVAGTTYTLDADIAITSHDTSTGVTVLTASGAGVAAGTRCRLTYIGI